MAYNKRFTCSWVDDAGYKWAINIWDKVFTPSPLSPYQFDMGESPPEIKWGTNGEERFEPIIGSKLEFSFLVKYAAPWISFVEDVLENYEEEDVFVELLSESYPSQAKNYNGNDDLVWVGFLFMDLEEMYDFSLT